MAPRDHAFPQNVTPTVFANAQPLKYSPPEQLAQGVAAVTTEDIRWSRCDIKAIALERGLLIYGRRSHAGRYGDWLMMTPPRIATRDDVAEIVAAVAQRVQV